MLASWLRVVQHLQQRSNAEARPRKSDGIGISRATAGKSLAARFGAGRKSRHIELRYLFVQHLVKHVLLIIKKIPGELNPADVFTKYVSRETLGKHLSAIQITSARIIFRLVPLWLRHLPGHAGYSDMCLR